ncbi:MAG: metalloregulator ArsR/SmtB family transcription factor [Lentisphaeria bacterium]|nr:metalloregulator ArsR/SmtB family transcription factor [Lentisphaeria bacterium]
MNSDEQQSLILKALADENRLRLLRLLLHEVLNVQELCEILDIPQPRVSRHLATLRSIGLVYDQREGSRVYYSLAKLENEFSTISGFMESIRQQEHDDLLRMYLVLEKRKHESQDFARESASEWDDIGAELHSSFAVMIALSQLTKQDLDLIDFGTGSGILLPVLSQFSKNVFAVDHSQEMLSQAKDKCESQGLSNVQFVQSDIDQLPNNLSKVGDCGLMHFVLHQLARPQYSLRQASECLKQGGRLVVVDLFKHEDDTAQQKYGSRWMGFDQEQLYDWLETAGLGEIKFYPLNKDRDGRPLFIASGVKK